MGLKLEEISKVYPDFRLDLDFQMRDGEILALLGPSGCGKTTTLRLIAGFIQQDTGRIIMDGRRIDGLPPHRRDVGIVFQEYALFPHLDVRGNVGFGLRMHRWGSAQSEQRIEELLQLVSLDGYGERSVTRLSGGEQQRVALARALAPGPKLLLLDEPLSALDAKLRRSLRQEILRIQRQTGITTVYVTHDQEEALVLGDRVIVMRRGQIEQIDTPRNVYNHPVNLFVAAFLGQGNRLLGRLTVRNGNALFVETPLGTLRSVWTDGSSARFGSQGGRPSEVGTAITVFFRPEHCRIDGAGPNRLKGRVTDVEYLGSHQLIGVAVGEHQLTLDISDQRSFASGEEVAFSVDPERICVFPAT